MSENEGMTKYQLNVFIKMIVQIIKDSKDKEEAISKLEKLLEENEE